MPPLHNTWIQFRFPSPANILKPLQRLIYQISTFLLIFWIFPKTGDSKIKKNYREIFLPPLKSASIFRFEWLRNLVTRDEEKKNVAKHAKNAWLAKDKMMAIINPRTAPL